MTAESAEGSRPFFYVADERVRLRLKRVATFMPMPLHNYISKS